MTSESELSSAEKYVRERWDRVVCGRYHNQIAHYFVALDYKQFVDCSPVCGKEAWQAAYAFTFQREREIAEVEEEIKMCEEYITFREKTLESGYAPVSFAEHISEHLACFRRILAREQATLAELKRGMK